MNKENDMNLLINNSFLPCYYEVITHIKNDLSNARKKVLLFNYINNNVIDLLNNDELYIVNINKDLYKQCKNDFPKTKIININILNLFEKIRIIKFDYIIYLDVENNMNHTDLLNKLNKYLNLNGLIFYIDSYNNIINSFNKYKYLLNYELEYKDIFGDYTYVMMKKTKMIFEEVYTVTTNNLDKNNYLTIDSIFDFFQDAAGKHSTLLNAGYFDYIKYNYIWMLVNIKVKIVNDLFNLSKVKVRTWPSDYGRIDFFRDYQLLDENNNLLAYSTSRWCVFDISTNKLVPASILEYKYINSSLSKQIEIEKIMYNDDLELFNQCDYKVMNSMIDHNGHVNNTKYVTLILDTINNDKLVKEININYLKQSRIKDIITVKIFSYGNDLLAISLNKDEICNKALISFKE